jgi:hypothetical protein
MAALGTHGPANTATRLRWQTAKRSFQNMTELDDIVIDDLIDFEPGDGVVSACVYAALWRRSVLRCGAWPRFR